jgi:hypothetical protein
MATRIKLRRDTAANWLESNPILAQGETGFETDSRAMKLGDGTTRWKDLKYAVTGNLKVTDNTIHGDDVVSISSGMGDRSNWVLTVNSNDGNTGDLQPSNAWTTSVAYDSMGNTFMTGIYGAPGGGSGMFLIKTDPNGQVMFNNYYDEYYAFGFSMIVDKNDDVVFVMAEYDGSSTDTVLVKVSGVDGTIMWQKYLADTDAASDDVALCVDIDPSNNVIIAGTTETGGQMDFWVGKFNGETGAAIWQRQYDSDGCEDSASGIAVDSQGNIGVVGSSYGPGTFLGVFKIAGTDGDVMWQKRVVNAESQSEEWNSGNAWVNGELYSSDICVDSNNDFYFNLTGVYCTDWTVAGIHKITSTGDWKWSKVVSYSFFLQGSSSLTCDSDNNVYLTSTLMNYKNTNQYDGNLQLNLVITKFNAAGRKIWGKALSRQQSEVFAGGGGGENQYLLGVGQTVAVNDDYILVGGGFAVNYPYTDFGFDNDWYQQPFLAQFDKAGTDFVKDGWTFKDNAFKIFNLTLSTDDTNWLNDLTENTADIVVTTADVTFEENTDTYTLAHINVSRVKTMTLDGARLHLPENGGLALGRKHIGHITSIGRFDLDGNEGNNVGGNTWINGVTGGADGNVYAVGGWDTNDQWNDGQNYEEIPLIWKIDSEGAIVWTAGNNLDQWGADMVDVAYNAGTNTIVALGHDNEDQLDNFDGAEGFNLFTLDAGSGTLKSVDHIRPTAGTPSTDSADMTPHAIALKSNGTPVVVGYINANYDEFTNVTNGAAGAPGSGTGILVINKSVFNRGDDKIDVVYPNILGYWYIGGSAIQWVNRYATVASINTTQAGTGAKFDIVLQNSSPNATVTVASGFAGTGYKVGNRFTILGTEFTDGVTPDNDLVFEVATVGIGGAITGLTTSSFGTSGFTGWGTYLAKVASLHIGADATFTITADPVTRAYTVVIGAGGQDYSVGDTVKVLGSLLGGVDSVNDAVITITATDDSSIDNITHTGLGQNVTIKLDVGTGTNFAQAGTYNVWHETDSDAFIWTPDWNVAVGGEAGYDSIYAVAVDTDDNIVVGGSSSNLDLPSNTTDWGNSAQSAFIAKYNSAGERLWAKAVDGHEGDNTVWGIVTDADNNIYGVMGSGPNTYDPNLIKLDSDGNFMWQVQLNYQAEDNWSSTWSIAMDADQNIIISGEQASNETETDRVGYDNNIQIAKFDRDGNPLWKRLLWSNNGMYTGYNDWYGNNLAVVGDKFVWGGVANRWNDNDDDIAVVAQLPVDGTGVGNIGNYYYDEVDVYVERWTDNTVFGPGKQIVRDLGTKLPSRTLALIEEPYEAPQSAGDPQSQDGGAFEDATGPLTIYANLDGKVADIREEGGADITGVKEIVFEDGTRQSTTAQDIPQVDLSITNRGNDSYYLRLEDRGHHIYMHEYRGVDICIPNSDKVPFPVGTSIVIVTGGDSRTVYSENDDDYMILAGADGDSSYSWTIPRWSMATLLKIYQGYNTDGTPNNYSEWMIAGPGLN